MARNLQKYFLAQAIHDCPENGTFRHWFWTETAAGMVLKAIRERCREEADASLRMTGDLLLVPLEQG